MAKLIKRIMCLSQLLLGLFYCLQGLSEKMFRFKKSPKFYYSLSHSNFKTEEFIKSVISQFSKFQYINKLLFPRNVESLNGVINTKILIESKNYFYISCKYMFLIALTNILKLLSFLKYLALQKYMEYITDIL